MPVDFKTWDTFLSVKQTAFYIIEYLENTRMRKEEHKNHLELSFQRITVVNISVAIPCTSPGIPHTPSF